MAIFERFSKRHDRTMYSYRFEHEGQTIRSKAVFKKQSDAIKAESEHRTKLNHADYATLSAAASKKTTVSELVDEYLERQKQRKAARQERNKNYVKNIYDRRS